MERAVRGQPRRRGPSGGDARARPGDLARRRRRSRGPRARPDALSRHRARAHVGVTGPPGVGKSTLISALVTLIRSRGLTAGVISVDPTSPFTNGALLGDRIRLADHFLDPGVFIRSMGTRGHAGGLSEATLQAVLILDAAGKDVIFVETVGTGQNEIGVLSIVDTVVLVLMPGSGDAVQALKAGIMEIPDVIAINKLDHPQTAMLVADVRQMLALGSGEVPPIVLTEALRGEGIDELWAAIEAHKAALEAAGELEERRAPTSPARYLRSPRHEHAGIWKMQ